MKDLIKILELAEALGFNTDILNIDEAVSIKKDVLDILQTKLTRK
jgi:hypothetical protein